MGADFLEKTTPSFEKCWDAGRVQLAAADLITRLPVAKSRSFAAGICRRGSLKKGDRVTVDKMGAALVASVGHTELARCDDFPAELLEAVEARCGVVEGTVDEVHETAGIAEISICIGDLEKAKP